LKNRSAKQNKKFKLKTKLKTIIITVTCHDCKLPRDTTVTRHVAIYNFLEKKLKN